LGLKLDIHNIFYVSSITKSLFSINQTFSTNMKLAFDKDNCLINTKIQGK
jgi:hypothetical protein